MLIGWTISGGWSIFDGDLIVISGYVSYSVVELQKQALKLPLSCSTASKYHHAQAVLCLAGRQPHLVHPTPQSIFHLLERMLYLTTSYYNAVCPALPCMCEFCSGCDSCLKPGLL
jgi:hypothetical protein